ncbi:PgsA Putative enzyme of poly-gamma-glutamate biosynthesis (capsule formation) [Candidatus Nanopelagicaceae bacterium]
MKFRIAILVCVITAFAILATQPISSPLKFNKSRDVVINVVGDIHGESAIDRTAIPALKRYFADGDLSMFNLETAVTNETMKEVKEYNFKTDLEFLQSLKSVGLNVATVGNNHSYDYGSQGFLDTLQNLTKAGISYVGGGVNSDLAYQGQIYKVNGLKIGVLGLAKVNGGPDSIAKVDRAGTTNGYDARSTEQAITAMKKVSDVLIILTHWGEEGSFCPRPSERSSAKKWSALGADIILGSHTHTLQPVILENNKLTAYSMGNFIFYSSKMENRSTGILKIRITPKKRISYTIQPMLINNLTKVPEKSAALYTPDIDCENQANITVR